jgi:NADPH:quinone reductase-like Zn-dependent oxidoreductase
MRRIRLDSAGFEIEDVAVPEPGPGQVLVRTEAVGVGIGMVRGVRAANGASGGEIVGRVTAVGAGVEGVEVGDRVGGVVLSGAYAEQVLALPMLVSRVPEEVAAGAALTLVRGGLVALCAIRAGRLAAGESVLVNAAASGVGHLALQLAVALGAGRVVAAIGSADKAGFVRDCGAGDVVTYEQESWGDPVDLVLDGVGGTQVQRGVDQLAPCGRLVAYSAGGGSVDAGSLLGSLRTVTGFSMGLLNRENPGLIAERRAELWHLLADGLLRPAWTDLPFDRLGEALELIGARKNRGRVLLRS